MCGICGIVGARLPPDRIEAMTDRLAHRGPDDSGLFVTPEAQLGHRRLSILDLSPAGHQPMTLGPLTLTFNGEIYNFRELRHDLPGPFRSDCDTEVLLHLWAREGPRCLDRLHGMFAFAIWDAASRTLWAARDRLGIKPLLYRTLPEGGLAFASELKALTELGRPPIDRTALADYFTYKCVPAPKTIYRGISQLPPAHRLTWHAGQPPVVERWWEPRPGPPITDAAEAAERVDDLLGRVIPEHTLADVPVGVFLSGGIDSTTLVAYLRETRTFTLGSDVRRRDESALARDVARHFGTEHHEEIAEAIDLDEALDTMPRIYDEPFGDSGAWAVYMVARMAREHVKVVLSGEGGDEVFLGYGKYSKWSTDRSPWLAGPLARLAPPFSRLGRSLARRRSTGLERYANYLAPFTLAQKRELLHPDLVASDYDHLWHLRPHWRPELEPLRRLQWIDVQVDLAGHLMTKVDRATMAHSLEARPALADHRLIELGLSIDPQLLRDVEGNRGKLVVRSLLESRVPPGHFDHKKRCFNLPVASWVRRDPARLTRALGRLEEAGVIVAPRRPRLSHAQTWTLLALDRWLTAAGGL